METDNVSLSTESRSPQVCQLRDVNVFYGPARDVVGACSSIWSFREIQLLFKGRLFCSILYIITIFFTFIIEAKIM